MAIYNPTGMPVNNVVGNIDYSRDENAGFKQEVRYVLESYDAQGVNLTNSLLSVIGEPTARAQFNGVILESIQNSPLGTNALAQKSPFYSNYYQRMEQLLENSENAIATESAMTGYAPIVSYMPFTLKKQWIDNVFKDVLMTEIPTSPVINYAVEKRYLKNNKTGAEYPLPECLYQDNILKEMLDASTGINIKEAPIAIADCKALNLISDTYFPGVVANDPEANLTPDLHIFKVYMTDTAGAEHEVFVNIKSDITFNNWMNNEIKYDVIDPTDGTVKETLTDTLVGNINFRQNTVTIMSTTGKVTKVCLRGKLENQWNRNSLDVERRVQPLQFTMPESGPRFNSAVSVENAADALALQNIDVIADNINVMGASLANFEDAEIKMFLSNSYDAQEKGASSGILYNELGENKMTFTGGFNAMPYDTYTGRISEWMKDSREYFERIIGQLKQILRSTNVVIVAIANPNLIRFLQDGIQWVFSDDTQISGVKLSYNFGVYTSAQDRVHVVTSMRLREDEGIRFVVIPLTQELITFKHFKYNMIIDRNYRDPVHSLLPNIMVTHRTLNVEVYPVQGLMTIDGRDLFSPSNLRRDDSVWQTKAVTPDAP